QRPHEALGMQAPANLYYRSQRQLPEKPRPMEYPGHFDLAFVNHNGCIFRQGKSVYITCLLKGETVGLEEIDNGIFDVYYGPLKLGLFKERILSKNDHYVRLLHL
ncbi:IS481 family transposase, partial [bacterium]|nr:IS481 family transposase [bacterium]